MLYLISLGLYDKEDMSIRAFNTAKKCDILYLDSYTHKFNTSLKELNEFIDKKIIKLSRKDIEENSSNILKKAKNQKVGLLIGGSCLAATTHISLLLDAKKEKIKTEVIHGSSILTAVGIIGLELYKYGAITSVPFDLSVKTPIDVINNNLKNNLHSLVLLDLNPEENKFLEVKEVCEYLIKNGIKKGVICARLGSEDFKIKYNNLEKLKNEDFGKPPYCVVIPSKKLHFVEEESLEKWKQN